MEGKKKRSSGKKQKSPKPAEEVYVVESVIDKKIENGETLYFIKWKDWPR
jgi:hypothetical protein